MPALLSCVLALLAFFRAAAARAQEANVRAAELASSSPLVQRTHALLLERARAIRDPALRRVTLEVLANPAPTFMAHRAGQKARERARRALVGAGLLDGAVSTQTLFPPLAEPAKAPQPFVAAPGGTLGHHHDHPGGLVVHTMVSLQAALDLEDSYRHRYGVSLDRDLIASAVLLHDAMKPWALQWRAHGSLTEQATVAQTGSHHVLILAEAFHRGLPPRLVVAIAAAHAPPTGDGAALVVGFLRAGAILAGVDPVEIGVLTRARGALELASPPSIEAAIVHLSDHDYVITDHAAAAVGDALTRLARRREAGASPSRLRWMRHRIQSLAPSMTLYPMLTEGGDERLRGELERRGIPLVDVGDGP